MRRPCEGGGTTTCLAIVVFAISCCLPPVCQCTLQENYPAPGRDNGNYAPRARFPRLEENLQSDAPDGLQAEAANDLVSRLVPEVARKVRIVVNRDWRSGYCEIITLTLILIMYTVGHPLSRDIL